MGREHFDAVTAEALIDRGKMVIQSRACMDCHTFFGNGAYYAPISPRLGSIPPGKRGRPSPAPQHEKTRW
jgi:hypothetical protein